MADTSKQQEVHTRGQGQWLVKSNGDMEKYTLGRCLAAPRVRFKCLCRKHVPSRCWVSPPLPHFTWELCSAAPRCVAILHKKMHLPLSAFVQAITSPTPPFHLACFCIPFCNQLSSTLGKPASICLAVLGAPDPVSCHLGFLFPFLLHPHRLGLRLASPTPNI